jgi:hypothetical protein
VGFGGISSVAIQGDSERIYKCHPITNPMTMYPQKAPSASLFLHLPPVAASPNFQLSTGYPQVGEEVIHNSPIWFHFASQIADVCKPFGYSDLT